MKNFQTRYKQPLLIIALLLLIGGVFTYKNLKTGLFPDITFPKIKIIADAGQQPVDKMMASVTIPLENIVRATEGLENIRSTTSRGSCEISVFLSWDVDINTAKAQIESFINQAQGNLLPNTAISVQKMNPSILPIMGYSLEGNLSQVELKKIAQYTVKPYLSSSKGVSSIAVIGGKEKEYQVVLKPDIINALGVTLPQIQNAIVNSNLLQSTGYIADYDRLYLTIIDNAVNKINDLEDLVIINTAARLIRLKDVANIQLAEAKSYVSVVANGKNVPLIAIIKQPNANLMDVNTIIEKKVAALSFILPKGVRLVPFYQQADFVKNSIKSIEDVLWIGLALALVIVVLFLRAFNASMVVLFTIPITLSLTLIILQYFGYTLNIMTLGAIAAAIGLMIDDVVIVIEQIHKIKEEHPDKSMTWCIVNAISHLFPAMVGSSLSTLVIFIPFVLMTGVAGAYFQVMAFTMIIALTASFFISWIIVPVLYLLFSKTKIKAVVKIKPARTTWIHQILNRPILGLSFVLICIVILIIIPSKLPSGFLPEMDEGSIVLDFNSDPGTSLKETDRMLSIVNNILDHQPEVAAYSSRLGTQMGFFITEPNRGDFLIKLNANRKKTTEEVAAEIRTKIEAVVPQLTVDFGQVIGDMLGDLMSSVQPIEIKLYGDDIEKIHELSQKIAQVTRKTAGTADVNDGIIIAGPELTIQPNVQKLAQMNMTPADFQMIIQTQIKGVIVSNMIDQERIINIRMIYPNATKTSIETLKNSNVLTPSGALVPLTTLANIVLKKGVAQMNRENQKSMGVITARLNNRDLGSTLNELRKNIQNQLNLPTGYHIEYGGEYQQQQQAFKELLTILISAFLLVFIVILFLFKKIKIALSILCLSLLGIAGCLFSLYITHTALNVGSYMGIIMIVGIIGENAIFTYQQYLDCPNEFTHIEKIEFSIAARLRPKLMTAFAAITALIPLALGIGAGAQLHQPLAITVIGGLIFALPLLLLVFPTLLKIIKS
ncbi:AcrB/AcrD/AcrF family protein [Putridiphycobacter roseus]|uniref:AcrB/AcrD/AcrF family protein n=1 Tax=Putridiphycobacter roseus TaxID=2219161 RepID=A0A2W1NTR7_9FLAO|nr:efflux RND transporter permease subunit [Putridiphycobacter roseus]PZE18128.1 AcrB/AcrD/AcrF family protein [Putridiphycobacter roseus]